MELLERLELEERVVMPLILLKVTTTLLWQVVPEVDQPEVTVLMQETGLVEAEPVVQDL
jgi:hypothetical protein